MRRRARLFGIAVVVAILLAACASTAQPTATPQPEISAVPLAPTAQAAATMSPLDVAKPLPNEAATAEPAQTVAPTEASQVETPLAATPTAEPAAESAVPTVDGPISDFENGRTSGWHISDEEKKTTDLSVVQIHDAAGQFALSVVSTLKNDEVHKSTETWIDLGRALRQGAADVGTQDFTNKDVHCTVFLPKDYAGNVGIRAFVKDKEFVPNWGKMLFPDATQVGTWIDLKVAVGDGDFDPGFDATQITMIGVRVELYNLGVTSYSPFLIDGCSVQPR